MRKEPLGKYINILSKALKTINDNGLQKYNITMEQARFLMYLEKNRDRDIFQKDLCHSFYSTKGSVSILLNNLENLKLIERYIGNDARYRKIKITDQALDLLILVRKELDIVENQLVEDFSEEQVDLLHLMINKMINNIK